MESEYPMLLATIGAVLVACATNAGAEASSPTDFGIDYQLRRLTQPTDSELAHEKAGAVYIYDTLPNHQVEKALDEQFERIGSMMFIRIKHLPPTGAGPVEIDDDCD